MNKEQKTIAYYDAHASKWAETRDQEFWIEELEKFKNYLPKGKIFEVGTGSGIEARFLSEMGYEYIGTDISDGLLETARKANPNLVIEKQSVYELDFKGELLDGFWAAAVLLHIPKERIDEALARIKSQLKEGAVGFISVKKGDGESVKSDDLGERFYSYYQPDELRGILEKAGFEVIENYEKIRKKETTFLVFFVRK